MVYLLVNLKMPPWTQGDYIGHFFYWSSNTNNISHLISFLMGLA